MPAGRNVRAQQRSQHFQGAGQNIGQHDVVAGLRRLDQIGQAAAHGHGVVGGIVLRCGDGSGIDIDGINLGGAKLGRANGQNTRAAAVVQHAGITHIGIACQPAQAHAGGGVRAGAKGQARIQPDDVLRLGGRFVPAGHNPEIIRNGNGGELRLCQPHPVLLGQGRNVQNAAACKKILRLQQARRFFGCFLRGKERRDERALPAFFGRGHAGFAKKRLLGLGLRVGIFYRNAQGIQRL